MIVVDIVISLCRRCDLAAVDSAEFLDLLVSKGEKLSSSGSEARRVIWFLLWIECLHSPELKRRLA